MAEQSSFPLLASVQMRFAALSVESGLKGRDVPRGSRLQRDHLNEHGGKPIAEQSLFPLLTSVQILFLSFCDFRADQISIALSPSHYLCFRTGNEHLRRQGPGVVIRRHGESVGAGTHKGQNFTRFDF